MCAKMTTAIERTSFSFFVLFPFNLCAHTKRKVSTECKLAKKRVNDMKKEREEKRSFSRLFKLELKKNNKRQPEQKGNEGI